MHWTGNADHAEALFARLDPGGPERRSEEDLYAAAGLPWIPPELREGAGEIHAADANALPALLELDQIRGDLHTHTTWSDGRDRLDAMARACLDRGYRYFAVTDHSRSSVQANGLDEKRLRKHIDAIREANANTKGISILAGSEVDILVDGKLDYDDDLLAELDVVVASPHASLKQDSRKATARLLKAIQHPLVHMSPDINALIEAAVEHDVALEINANPLRLDLRDTHVKAAVDAGALIAIDTDAHAESDFDLLRYGILTARRGWLTPKQCINTWTKQKIHKWLKAKR